MDEEDQPRVYICPDCGHEIKLSPTNRTGHTRCNPCGKSIIFDYELHRQYSKNYRLENKDAVNTYLRKWRRENPEKIRSWGRTRYRKTKKKLKDELFNKLGSVCQVCGEPEVVCLVIHHKYGLSTMDTAYRRRTSSLKRYREYLKEPIETLALLCANCHRKVHAELITLG